MIAAEHRNDARERADLLGRVDLAALFVDLGLPQGRNRQWPCPNPTHAQTGKTPPVSIGRGSEGYDLWSCHGCSTGGSAVDLLRFARGLDLAEAFDALRRLAGIPELATTPRPRPTVAPAPLPDPDADRLEGDDAGTVMVEYLETRRWSAEVADAHGLYAVGHHGARWVRHPYRIGGEARWWQDRIVSPAGREPKWMSPSGMKRVVYAQDLRDTLTNTGRLLWVVEGPADAIALAHVLPDAAIVGVPGTAGVDRWAPMLKGRDVLIVTDPDDAGDKAAAELAELTVSGGGRADRLRPPADLDDWRRAYPDDDAWADAITAELDAQCPALDLEGVTR